MHFELFGRMPYNYGSVTPSTSDAKADVYKSLLAKSTIVSGTRRFDHNYIHNKSFLELDDLTIIIYIISRFWNWTI